MERPVVRPYIVCHMLTALDGRIAGPFMDTDAAQKAREEYERIIDAYHPDAWLCDRATADKNFTLCRKPVLSSRPVSVPEGDYLAARDARMYYVSVDPEGKIGWESSILRYGYRPAAHIIEVLTGRAASAYRDFLRRMGISYIIAGEDSLSCTQAAQKLKSLFGIDTLLIEGGGATNDFFLREGLIDELSLVLAPVSDGGDGPALFRRPACLPARKPVSFSLKGIERLAGDGLWLRYKTKKWNGGR